MIGHSTGVVGGIPRALVLSYLLVLFQPSLFGRIVGLLSLIPFYSLPFLSIIAAVSSAP
jgi:hypothetical protein